MACESCALSNLLRFTCRPPRPQPILEIATGSQALARQSPIRELAVFAWAPSIDNGAPLVEIAAAAAPTAAIAAAARGEWTIAEASRQPLWL